LGLLFRNDEDDYIFINEKEQVEQGKMYYLYYRDKPLDLIQPLGNGEESKKNGGLTPGSTRRNQGFYS